MGGIRHTCIFTAEEHEQYYDLVERMLRYEPAERITMAEALKHPWVAKALFSKSHKFRRDAAHTVGGTSSGR